MKSGAAIPRIVLRDFKRLPILVPPGELRRAFERFAGPLHEMIRKTFTASDRLKQARDLLLPRLMSGELSVAKAERELEAVA